MTTKNFVPRANNEGSIGTATKEWNAGYFGAVYVAGAPVTGSLSSVNYANNAGTANIANHADWSGMSNIPSTFAPAAHNQAWGTITGAPALWNATADLNNPLTGFTPQSGTVGPNDSVLVGMEKLAGFNDAHVLGIALTGLTTTAYTPLANSDGVITGFNKLNAHDAILDQFEILFPIIPVTSLFSLPCPALAFNGTISRADLQCRVFANNASLSPNSSAKITMYNGAGTSLDDITFTTGSTTDSTWNFSVYQNESYWCGLDAEHSLSSGGLTLGVRGTKKA